MVSENTRMIEQCDLLIRSIRFFSNKDTKIYFSIVLQGNEQKLPSNPFEVKKIEIKNANYREFFNCNISNYLIKNAEFYFSPQIWTLGMPCRWFVEPKSETCTMIDADILACNNLNELYDLNKNKIYGRRARKNKEIIGENDWKEINFSEEDIKNYYVNFGLVVVPSIHLKKIGLEIFKNYNKMKKLHEYFAGQLALAHAIKNLNLEMDLLPSKFNYYDLDEFPGREEILFLHLMKNKDAYKKHEIENKYIQLVQEIKKEIVNSKKLI